MVKYCKICGRKLKNKKSIDIGMGFVCRQKNDKKKENQKKHQQEINQYITK